MRYLTISQCLFVEVERDEGEYGWKGLVVVEVGHDASERGVQTGVLVQ